MSVMPIAIPPRVGEVLQFSPGERLVWKATSATTASFDRFELTALPGHAGAPEVDARHATTVVGPPLPGGPPAPAA